MRPRRRARRLQQSDQLRLEALDRVLVERGAAQTGHGFGHAQRVGGADGRTQVAGARQYAGGQQQRLCSQPVDAPQHLVQRLARVLGGVAGGSRRVGEHQPAREVAREEPKVGARGRGSGGHGFHQLLHGGRGEGRSSVGHRIRIRAQLDGERKQGGNGPLARDHADG